MTQIVSVLVVTFCSPSTQCGCGGQVVGGRRVAAVGRRRVPPARHSGGPVGRRRQRGPLRQVPPSISSPYGSPSCVPQRGREERGCSGGPRTPAFRVSLVCVQLDRGPRSCCQRHRRASAEQRQRRQETRGSGGWGGAGAALPPAHRLHGDAQQGRAESKLNGESSQEKITG